MADTHRFGFATLAGAPNVGKSTLMNALVGEKISIVSRRPQTTRHRIIGICTEPEFQIAFVDTPGLHKDQKKSLNRVINRTALSSLIDVDVILFMIDTTGWTSELISLFRPVKESGRPVILLINKIDKLKNKEQLLPLISDSMEVHNFASILPLCSIRLDNRQDLLESIARVLPEGPPGFPAEQISDRSEKFLASELIREQSYLLLGQELPYSIAVEVSNLGENDQGVLIVDATIFVEKPGQKSIVIGKGGQQLKKIGSAARKQMEQAFGSKVFLNLWVKVRKNWSDGESHLHALGYGRDE